MPAGALVVSRHGCAPAMPTRVELDYYLANADRIPRPDQDVALTRLHRVTAPRTPHDEVLAFAFDHRNQFFDLAQEAGPGESRLPKLKRLFVDAVEQTARGRSLATSIGLLCDDRYGQDALDAATGRGWWIGRPVELPGSNPLQFDRGRSIGTTLVSWPHEHIVKCLVKYHPYDTTENRLEQEAQIRSLYDAVQASGHELLLEIIPPKELPREGDTVLRALKRLYNLGIHPEWWKLEPMSAEQWRGIDALIAERDPYCRGVVLLGLAASIEALRAGFDAASASTTCRGLRCRPHHLRGAVAPLAFRCHRRRGAGARGARQFRDAYRCVARIARLQAHAKSNGMSTVRLTTAQALVRYLAALRTESGGVRTSLFGGVFAIFGHGNVAGIGEALYRHRDTLPTYRAHNEQAMAHAAIAWAKAHMRRRMMACTTSIGPGATNLVTAAALAHVNRLPVLFLPGDVFMSARAGSGVAASGGFPGRHRVGQRLLQACVALFRPHRLSAAIAERVAARRARADRPGPVRSGDARAAAGRADDRIRFPGGFLRSPGRVVPPRSRRWQKSSRAPPRCCANRGGR